MAHPGLRFLGLLIVVAGVFGMHGLSSHGVRGMDVVPGTVAASQPMTASLVRVASAAVGMEVQAVAITNRSGSLRGSDSGRGGMLMGITMMCVVILGTALLALLERLRGARSWSTLWARPNRERVVMHPSRESAVPSSLDLSIQRC